MRYGERTVRSIAATLAAIVVLVLAGMPQGRAQAPATLHWWHALTGANNQLIVDLAREFNASQQDYEVVPTYKGSYVDTMNAGIAAFHAGNAPHIMQVFEVGTASMMAATGAIKPVHLLMKEAGEKFDPNAYLPSIAGYYSTPAGEMLSLPFNSSSAVMWINRDAFRKSGLDPDAVPKTWPELFEAARTLKAAGYSTCGFSNAWATWINIEQFSAWHDLPLATRGNGMEGFDAELRFNSPLHVKHLEKLVKLQKEKVYDYSGRTNTGEGRFTSGECPIFLTSSAFYGNVRASAGFDFASAPMPYYPEAKGAPQNAIIGGGSLWVMGGKTPAEYKGVARFFAFLSDTDRQVAIHKASGYLPITRAAYRQARASGYYKEFPDLEMPLLVLNNKPPTANSRGLRLGNMLQLRDVWASEIEAALSGRKSAADALDAAVLRGNAMLRAFERTALR